MTKKKKTPLGIFAEALTLYFSNFGQFVKYMTFPVLGQLIGLILIFSFTYVYTKNLPLLIEKYGIFDDFNTLVLCSVLVALPGLIIFLKAFWEYLVAYGAINSMLENMLKSGKVYDFDAHTESIKRRTPSFVGLWLLVGIFTILSVCPLLWVPAGVLAVFFVLIFQVFTYEPELSPVGCARKSMLLIKGHFGSTFMLIALLGALTYYLIPEGINTLLEWSGGAKKLSDFVLPLVNQLPLDSVNGFLKQMYAEPIKPEEVALITVSALVSQVFIQYTLPLRSLLCGLWYKELNGSLPKIEKKKKSSKSKKPSEVLMEESHKKFGGNTGKTADDGFKTIDRNILKRAMEGVNNGVNNGVNKSINEDQD